MFFLHFWSFQKTLSPTYQTGFDEFPTANLAGINRLIFIGIFGFTRRTPRFGTCWKRLGFISESLFLFYELTLGRWHDFELIIQFEYVLDLMMMQYIGKQLFNEPHRDKTRKEKNSPESVWFSPFLNLWSLSTLRVFAFSNSRILMLSTIFRVL